MVTVVWVINVSLGFTGSNKEPWGLGRGESYDFTYREGVKILSFPHKLKKEDILQCISQSGGTDMTERYKRDHTGHRLCDLIIHLCILFAKPSQSHHCHHCRGPYWVSGVLMYGVLPARCPLSLLSRRHARGTSGSLSICWGTQCHSPEVQGVKFKQCERHR